MRTAFRARQPFADIFLDCARKQPCNSPARPTRFIEKMMTNQGSIGALSGFGTDEEGLERKNPVIAALGDSVTAGHFESLLPCTEEGVKKFMEEATRLQKEGKGYPTAEITDSRESYLEKFRYMLIDKYEKTSVCAINAGIAGDNLIAMSKRAERDVIRYQPDLVLINGVLNWDNSSMGTPEKYKEILIKLVRRIKAETEADIILLTPNGDVANDTVWARAMGQPAVEPTTPERVKAVRETAKEEQVCLADVYAVWEAARDAGCPWKELLANEVNHPGVEGHEVYAITLMKLFE